MRKQNAVKWAENFMTENIDAVGSKFPCLNPLLLRQGNITKLVSSTTHVAKAEME